MESNNGNPRRMIAKAFQGSRIEKNKKELLKITPRFFERRQPYLYTIIHSRNEAKKVNNTRKKKYPIGSRPNAVTSIN